MPGFFAPTLRVYLREDFVLGSEETLLRTVGLERSLGGQWAIHHPHDLSLPQSFSKVSCQSSCALRKSAFSFFITSLLRSYLCGCPEASEEVVLCLNWSLLSSTLPRRDTHRGVGRMKISGS